MLLDAAKISHLQSCPRRFLIENDWRVLRWRAKSLFDASLRKGILDVSQNRPAADVAKERVADFLQAAANPGLDIPHGQDSYKIAMDFAAMLQTILRAAGKWRLPRLAESIPVRMNNSHEWLPLSFQGPDERLHRFVTVDGWNEDALRRELHGWYVVGDTVAAGRPMTIHVIEIGKIRDGRRASPWARAWRHPTMPGLKTKFVSKEGKPLKGWMAVYLADDRGKDAGEWVEQMYNEGVAQRIVHELNVPAPGAEMRAEVMGQILLEAARGSVLISERASRPWGAIPMSRGACDNMIPCPWQEVCYSKDMVNIESIGLYKLKSENELGSPETMHIL